MLYLSQEGWEKGVLLREKSCMCLVDPEKAFNRVAWKVFERALRKKGIPEVLVRSVMSLYERTKMRIIVDSELSDELEVKVGMHQVSVLSPFLFAVMVDVFRCCQMFCQRG